MCLLVCVNSWQCRSHCLSPANISPPFSPWEHVYPLLHAPAEGMFHHNQERKNKLSQRGLIWLSFIKPQVRFSVRPYTHPNSRPAQEAWNLKSIYWTSPIFFSVFKHFFPTINWSFMLKTGLHKYISWQNKTQKSNHILFNCQIFEDSLSTKHSICFIRW